MTIHDTPAKGQPDGTEAEAGVTWQVESERASLPAIADQPSLQERTYRALRAAILSGQLQVGERIYEAELAKQLAVSRNPVRDSIRRLQQDGLVDVRPRSGIYVSSISMEEADDIYRIRGALEGLAARLAAERISTTELESLEQLLHAGSDVVRNSKTVEDVAIVSGADRFHRAVHEYAHSPQLIEPLALIYARVLHYRNVTLALPGRADVASLGHEDIFRAIARHDGARAEAVMRDHIEGARISLMRHLDSVHPAVPADSSSPGGCGDD